MWEWAVAATSAGSGGSNGLTNYVVKDSRRSWGSGSNGSHVGFTARRRGFTLIELGAVYNAVNFTNKTSDPSNATVVATQLRVFLCPSEANQQAFTSTSSAGVISTSGVSNYGWCEGTWYTFGGFTSPIATPGAIGSNLRRTFASFTDGLSSTLLGSEVKTYTSAYHDCGGVPAPGPIGPTSYPDVATVLASVAAAPASGCRVASAPAGMPGGGHSHWCNGNSFHDGFTTALPPNTRSSAGPLLLDSDLTTEDEDDGGPTYAAVTSRSHHPGIVNAVFGDGSVHTIKSSVNYQTWRALGTVGGFAERKATMRRRSHPSNLRW